jgi:CO/xanthine dehydrogenase Mo-binding subunit
MQVPARVQDEAEGAVLPKDRVSVHNLLMGGGFGRRALADSVARAVRIARQVDGPLKVNWSREEDIQHDHLRPYYRPLRIHENPQIDVYRVAHCDTPSGVGEVGTPGVAPAIANAIWMATGKRLRRVPSDTTQIKV